MLNLSKALDLRYGENPHQKATLLVGKKPAEASVAFARQLHGKELSYINLLDADAALAAVKELADPAACIVKHATPCGFATAAGFAHRIPQCLCRRSAGGLRRDCRAE